MEEDGQQTNHKDKLTVYAAVKSANEELGKNNTLVGTFSMDKEAKLLITEMVYRKLEVAAWDAEAFASHAKRNNINLEDIKLLFRRNKKIMELLRTMEEEEEKDKLPMKRKRADIEPDPSTS